MDTTRTLQPPPISPTEAAGSNTPEARKLNRHERRGLVARMLTKPERRLLRHALHLARGSRERRAENAAALELAQARETAFNLEALKRAVSTSKR